MSVWTYCETARRARDYWAQRIVVRQRAHLMVSLGGDDWRKNDDLAREYALRHWAADLEASQARREALAFYGLAVRKGGTEIITVD